MFRSIGSHPYSQKLLEKWILQHYTFRPEYQTNQQFIHWQPSFGIICLYFRTSKECIEIVVSRIPDSKLEFQNSLILMITVLISLDRTKHMSSVVVNIKKNDDKTWNQSQEIYKKKKKKIWAPEIQIYFKMAKFAGKIGIELALIFCVSNIFCLILSFWDTVTFSNFCVKKNPSFFQWKKNVHENKRFALFWLEFL